MRRVSPIQTNRVLQKVVDIDDDWQIAAVLMPDEKILTLDGKHALTWQWFGELTDKFHQKWVTSRIHRVHHHAENPPISAVSGRRQCADGVDRLHLYIRYHPRAGRR